MRFSRLTSLAFEAISRLAFPALCVLCQQGLDLSEKVLCLRCKQSLEVLRPPLCETCSRPIPPYAANEKKRCGECLKGKRILRRLYAVVPFSTTHRLLLHKIKFGKKRWVLDSYQPLIERFIRDQKPEAVNVVVPVPLDSNRKRNREFNQAEDLAQRVAERLNVAMEPAVLKRRGGREPQSILKRKERILNLKGQFFVKQSRKVKDRSILLVDDIYTTGTTIYECANTLKEAGAREISAFVLARTT